MSTKELEQETTFEEQDQKSEEPLRSNQETTVNGAAETGAEQHEEEAAEAVVCLEDKYQELFSQYQRLQADFDNFRKRLRREKEDALRFAQESVITELLPVIDNLQRALTAGNESAESLKNGVELICRQLEQVLKKQGVEEIPALGNPFDPTLHQAVMQLATDEHPHNSVVQELQKGYTLYGRVLRPSMVQVADNPNSPSKGKSEQVDGAGKD